MEDTEQPTSVQASAGGIMQCLRMLAEEAIALGLFRSADAILTAFQACHAEQANLGLSEETAFVRDPASIALH